VSAASPAGANAYDILIQDNSLGGVVCSRARSPWAWAHPSERPLL